MSPAALFTALWLGVAVTAQPAPDPPGSAEPVRVEAVRTGPNDPIARVYTRADSRHLPAAAVIIHTTQDRADGAARARRLLARERFRRVAIAVVPIDDRTGDRSAGRAIAALAERSWDRSADARLEESGGDPAAIVLASSSTARRALVWAMQHPGDLEAIVLDRPRRDVIGEDARMFFELGQRLDRRALRVRVVSRDEDDAIVGRLRTIEGMDVAAHRTAHDALAEVLPALRASAEPRVLAVPAGEDGDLAAGETTRFLLDGPGGPVGEARTEIVIWRPAGVSAGEAGVPVLYALNGSHALAPGPGFLGDLGVDETIDELAGLGGVRVPVVVVVPIDAMLAGVPRTDDAFVRRAEAASAWLARTVAPRVERRLGRTTRARGVVLGAGAAAVPALLASLDAPERFSGVVLESCPMPGASGGAIRDRINTAGNGPRRVSIVSGSEDARPGDPAHPENAAHASWTRDLGRAMERLGVESDALRVEVRPGERAHASAWSRRLGGAVRFVLDR